MMVTKPELEELERSYYEDLGRFRDLCYALIERGQAYEAVLLGHELHRFLYPVEPFAKFVHTAPVPFMVEHLSKLLALGSASLDTVHGYSFDPATATTR